MTSITFFVEGEPKAQPRPRAFARRFGDKWQARVYDPGTAEGWKSAIAVAAKPHIPATPIARPISLTLRFHIARPKSHYRSGRNRDQLKADTTFGHCSKPDLDNLEKAVMDALSVLGFWSDDSHVCNKSSSKAWCAGPVGVGCAVRIEASL